MNIDLLHCRCTDYLKKLDARDRLARFKLGRPRDMFGLQECIKR